MRPPLPNQSRGSRASELLELLRDSMESAGLPRPLLPGAGRHRCAVLGRSHSSQAAPSTRFGPAAYGRMRFFATRQKPNRGPPTLL